ncbi:hypothetical protein Pelo_16640 [Pelomyxa schiedti]|nr:hypothetical protein Pelo_16640 [Pelomyxa schiedti]
MIRFLKKKSLLATPPNVATPENDVSSSTPDDSDPSSDDLSDSSSSDSDTSFFMQGGGGGGEDAKSKANAKVKAQSEEKKPQKAKRKHKDKDKKDEDEVILPLKTTTSSAGKKREVSASAAAVPVVKVAVASGEKSPPHVVKAPSPPQLRRSTRQRRAVNYMNLDRGGEMVSKPKVRTLPFVVVANAEDKVKHSKDTPNEKPAIKQNNTTDQIVKIEVAKSNPNIDTNLCCGGKSTKPTSTKAGTASHRGTETEENNDAHRIIQRTLSNFARRGIKSSKELSLAVPPSPHIDPPASLSVTLDMTPPNTPPTKKSVEKTEESPTPPPAKRGRIGDAIDELAHKVRQTKLSFAQREVKDPATAVALQPPIPMHPFFTPRRAHIADINSNSSVPTDCKRDGGTQSDGCVRDLPDFPYFKHVHNTTQKVSFVLAKKCLKLRPLESLLSSSIKIFSSPVVSPNNCQIPTYKPRISSGSMKSVLENLTKMETSPTSIKSLIQTHVKNPYMLWVESYKPELPSQICSNLEKINEIVTWLESWVDGNSSKKKSKQKENETTSLMIVHGPGCCGKTAAVFACANELEMKVIEVNTSIRRCGTYLNSALKEATRSKRLSTDTDQQEVVSTTSPSVILFDEADIYFSDERGFYRTLGSLSCHTKSPILITCNELTTELKALSTNSKCVQFAPLTTKDLAQYMKPIILSAVLSCTFPVPPGGLSWEKTLMRCDGTSSQERDTMKKQKKGKKTSKPTKTPLRRRASEMLSQEFDDDYKRITEIVHSVTELHLEELCRIIYPDIRSFLNNLQFWLAGETGPLPATYVLRERFMGISSLLCGIPLFPLLCGCDNSPVASQCATFAMSQLHSSGINVCGDNYLAIVDNISPQNQLDLPAKTKNLAALAIMSDAISIADWINHKGQATTTNSAQCLHDLASMVEISALHCVCESACLDGLCDWSIESDYDAAEFTTATRMREDTALLQTKTCNSLGALSAEIVPYVSRMCNLEHYRYEQEEKRRFTHHLQWKLEDSRLFTQRHPPCNMTP